MKCRHPLQRRGLGPKELGGSGAVQPVTLFRGVRIVGDLYGEKQFRRIAADRPAFRYIPAQSGPAANDDRSGVAGFVHEAAERCPCGSLRRSKAYLCGPSVMVDACIRPLVKGRLSEPDIHAESFLIRGDGASLSKSPLYNKIQNSKGWQPTVGGCSTIPGR